MGLGVRTGATLGRGSGTRDGVCGTGHSALELFPSASRRLRGAPAAAAAG